MSSGGEKIEALDARTLGLVAAALVAISLLLTAPLASVASARAEARAGGAVAIAGGDDCDVATNEDVTETNENLDEDSGEEDIFGMEDEEDNGDQTQNEDNANQTQDADENNASQTQYEDEDNASLAQYEDENDLSQDENNDDQVQDGAGGAVVARAGDAVAIAGDDCDADTDTTDTDTTDTDTTDTDTIEDLVIEDDEEMPKLTQQDGETQDDSGVSTLPLAGEPSNEQQSAGETTMRRGGSSLGGEFGTNKSGEKLRREKPGLRQDRPKSSARSKNDWPLLRKGELGRIGEPRRFEPKPNAVMTLSIRALGLYDVPVRNANTKKAFDRGVVHAPDTAYPWDGTNQKNVFLAGHRLGPPEKDGRLVFYDLDELKPGDEVILKDRKGQSYKYRVRELFKVGPNDAWVADTLVGRDLLTLQTYTLPNSEDRLIVRADRI